jgi:hypothetical protein
MNNPWDEITIPSKELSSRRVNAEHPVDLFWARNHIGQYLFVCEFDVKEDLLKIKLPELVGVRSMIIESRTSTEPSRFVLILNEQANWEIFYSICTDIIHSTSSMTGDSNAVKVILRRLERWHDFLKKKRPQLLSEEQIKGLIGELVFIHNHLIPIFGPGQAIKFWQGPEGSPQDFNVNDSAIEVKCKLGAAKPYVKISSIDQLCPKLPKIYLFVVTLGKTYPEAEGAINLPTLISSIRLTLEESNSEQIERFNDLLYMIGYLDSPSYLDFSYLLTREDMYKVTDKFPKICKGDIHYSINQVSYNISIDECDSYLALPDWMDNND